MKKFIIKFDNYISIKNIILLFFLFFVVSCKSQDKKSELYGRWFNLYNNNNYIDFRKESLEVGTIDVFKYQQKWFVHKNGLIGAYINGVENEIFYNYFFVDNFLVISTKKTIQNHIDEISIFSKEKIFYIPPSANSKIIVHVTSENQGLFMISFPNFEINKQDININRIIKLNKSFIESNIEISSYDYILKNFEFYLKDQLLPIFMDDELASKKKSIDGNEVIVCFYGLNQIGRNEINEVVGEKILGNVLILFIGQYKLYSTFPNLKGFFN